uniref:Uncharacterized protein n=1 Tax=Romanomermis culicivorax TaxID=13658 RepID=A0A915KBD2_ROMCU
MEKSFSSFLAYLVYLLFSSENPQPGEWKNASKIPRKPSSSQNRLILAPRVSKLLIKGAYTGQQYGPPLWVVY